MKKLCGSNPRTSQTYVLLLFIYCNFFFFNKIAIGFTSMYRYMIVHRCWDIVDAGCGRAAYTRPASVEHCVRSPDGHCVSEILERPVERRNQADGRAGTGWRRRRVRVMPVFGPVPVVADSVSATTVDHAAPGDVMGLRVHFLIVGQVTVFFVYVFV